MSADYRILNVVLTVTTDKSEYLYSSKKIAADGTSSENRQHLINNPIPLKEKTANALYDVAKKFVNDFIKKKLIQ